ncbi:MAG: TonB-dependent receptor [Phycisphaerae bacterium]|nr:TonB-dependent receptor [Gemmatimonadaceae bacterium]
MTTTIRACAFVALAYSAAALGAQTTPPTDSAVRVESFRITAERDRKSAITKLTLPASVSITAEKVRETVNVVDTEDALKYLPSLFLRKRNNGDTQATLATRSWGVSSSARSLVFADGVPLTALIANNNTLGAPRWGLVAPEEIDRVDVMYGPYSAAYSGNSMGAVVEITTRTPEKLEGSISATQSMQRFDLYGTRDNYGTSQVAATIGNKFGKFSLWLSGNYQDSHSQPLSYVTGATFPTGTTGGFAETNKLGVAANVLGASGLLHTRMTNGKLRAAYDITPTVRAAYTFGYWNNDADALVDTYTQRAGVETYAGLAGFASGYYNLGQQHLSHAASVRSDTRRDWDFEAVATTYRIDKDEQRSPTAASSTSLTFNPAGRVAVLNGTGWSTLDVKGAWHRGGPTARHTVTFGLHADRYALLNPTYNTPDWTTGVVRPSVVTEGDGKTSMRAVWAQDSWQIHPQLRFTLGGRYERWRAYDGYNVNGSVTVSQPEAEASKFSPKAVLVWAASPDVTLTVSAAKAYRFATASELFQLVSTGTTFSSPNPDLKPDDVFATELRAERRFARARVQVALFNDEVHDAIVAQFRPLVPGSATLYSFLSNVDHARTRGAELVFGTNGLGLSNVDLSGSVTYLDARTLALSGQASATAPSGSAIGKRLPNVPEWRATAQATVRPFRGLSVSLSGRYSDIMYTTLDNADVHTNTWQGFTEWFVADARVSYTLRRHWSAALGADNLTNRKYFLFHPFPQRTFISNLKYTF